MIECVCANQGCTNTFIAQENRMRNGLRSGLCDECRRCTKNRHIIGRAINDDLYAPVFLGWVRRGARNIHGIAKYHCTKCDKHDFVRDVNNCESVRRYFCLDCLNYQRTKSNGEELVSSLLFQLGYDFVREKIFSGCLSPHGRPLRFDFYLPPERICIEYDGEQHYVANDFFGGIAQLQRNQTYDHIKDEWCRQNHISMIRIPYTVYAKKLLDANYLRNKIAMARKEY